MGYREAAVAFRYGLNSSDVCDSRRQQSSTSSPGASRCRFLVWNRSIVRRRSNRLQSITEVAASKLTLANGSEMISCAGRMIVKFPSNPITTSDVADVDYSLLVLVPTLLLPAGASVSDLCHPSNPFPRA